MNTHSSIEVFWANLTILQKRESILEHCPMGASASECVSALNSSGIFGLTRSSMIGFVFRSMNGQWKFGTPSKNGGSTPIQKGPPKGSKNNVAYRVKTVKKTLPAPPKQVRDRGIQSNPVLLEDLNQNQCRYPLWDDDAPIHEKFYCGGEKDHGSVYCAGHRKVCCTGYFNPNRKRNAA